MINKLKPKSEFSRNVLTLMTGTTVAQAIPIAISPVLTRIYTPEDFGVFALYMSLTSLIAVIATGRYELAIMLPPKKEDAKHLFILSLIIASVISLMVLIVVILFNNQIINMLGNQQISNWLYFIPLTILLTGIYQSLNYWNSRNNNYKNISISRIVNTSTNTGVNLVGSYIQSGAFGLIVGSIFGQIIGIFSLYHSNKKINPYRLNRIKIFALAYKYKKFPLLNSLHAFVNILKNNVVTIYISIKYSSTTLGFYYFVLRIMQLPSSLLGTSLAQVFYKEASVIYARDRNIQRQVKALILKLSILAGLPAIVLFFYSKDLFIFVFGSEWKVSGEYAKALIPYIFFHFIASPLGMIPLITNLQDKALYWGIIESFLFVGTFIIGYNIYEDLSHTLILLSIVFSLYFPVYFLWIYKIAKEKE